MDNQPVPGVDFFARLSSQGRCTSEETQKKQRYCENLPIATRFYNRFSPGDYPLDLTKLTW